mgnify:CR=1 FL=1
MPFLVFLFFISFYKEIIFIMTDTDNDENELTEVFNYYTDRLVDKMKEDLKKKEKKKEEKGGNKRRKLLGGATPINLDENYLKNYLKWQRNKKNQPCNSNLLMQLL